MRIIIICGNPDCQEEYPADTEDRSWECAHCGRERPNLYYPFLTAHLMNARIHSDEADWKEHHDELLQKAQRKVADLMDHMQLMRRDLEKLRVRLSDEDRAKFEEDVGEVEPGGFLEGWAPEAPEDDMVAWRELHDNLLEGAREEILALEDVVHRLEDQVRAMKAALGIA
jgi:hypothetical protein